MSKKNICFFCGDLSRGGGTEKITSIISSKLSDAYNIYIIDIMNEKKEVFFLYDNVTIIHIKQFYKFSILRQILELIRILRKYDISILINVDIMLIIYSYIPCKLFKSKIISWEQFNYYNNIGSSNTKKIRQFCLKHTDYYINLTKEDMNTFKQNFVIRSPITYIYNPIESSIDSQYDINSKKLITVGNFYEDKGFDFCVKMGETIFSKYPDWKWYLCGDGVEFENIKKMIEQSKYKQNFILTGRIKNINKYMSESSLYISTSKTEGFGLVLIEAQNNSLPVIAFDVPFGPREIILDGINGYLIQPFNLEDMISQIIYLIQNEEKRLYLSKHSKDKFEEFSVDNIILKWKSILDKLI